MKELVQRARELGGAMAGAVRRAVDPPLDGDARPLDVKRAIVEAVEQRVEPAGGGRRVLAADAVQVIVLAEDVERRRALEAVMADLRDTVARRLLELQCTVRRDFAVSVSYVRRPPAQWEPGQRLAVRLIHDESPDRHAAAGAHPVNAVPPMPALALTVVRGQAAHDDFSFTGPVIRLGRSADPTDERGRPRFNDVAFLENDSPENRTVTRGHAVIRFNHATGEYRLFDEGSANGTRVIRGGEVIDVPRRDPVGLALKSGDEVQLGKAALRLRIEEPIEGPPTAGGTPAPR